MSVGFQHVLEAPNRPAAPGAATARRRQRLGEAAAGTATRLLHAERPRRQALLRALQALADVVREETPDSSPEEWKQAAKEVVLATLKNAPALLNAAHQARLLT